MKTSTKNARAAALIKNSLWEWCVFRVRCPSYFIADLDSAHPLSHLALSDTHRSHTQQTARSIFWGTLRRKESLLSWEFSSNDDKTWYSHEFICVYFKFVSQVVKIVLHCAWDLLINYCSSSASIFKFNFSIVRIWANIQKSN